MSNWSVRAWYRVPLYLFLSQDRLGQQRDQVVYIVADGDQAIYVGQTRSGVLQRLKNHVQRRGRLGAWMLDRERSAAGIICDILLIVGDLDDAERYCISKHAPSLNRVIYKAHRTMPPISVDPVQVLSLEEVVQSSLLSIPSAPIRTDMPTRDEQEALMDRLYAKAYRDPNHPTLEDGHAKLWHGG